MKYRRSEAKDHARAHMKGIWAAALMPYAEDLSIDEKGFRKLVRGWPSDVRKYLARLLSDTWLAETE